jgi:hypothetical protein
MRGLLNKTDELTSFLSPNFPHVLCLTEHHLKDSEIDLRYVGNYKCGAKFCRKSFKNGGVSIFMHNIVQCTNIELGEFCKEQDIEVCAVKINFFIFNPLQYKYLQITNWKCFVFLAYFRINYKFVAQ